jgi:hypothetical protein
MNRRTVLRFGLGGAAVLAVSGVGLSLRPGVRHAPAAALSVLGPVEFSVLAAIADRMAPAMDGYPSAASLQVAERIDALLATLEPEAGEELCQLLRLLDNALVSALLGGPATPFTALSAQRQDAVLMAWRDSRLTLRRSAFKALRSICLSTYFGHPAVAALVGYPGPPDLSGMALPEPIEVPA